MTHTTPLAEAKAEALKAARDHLAETTPAPQLDPVPEGYYARPEVPDTEVTEALSALGIYRTSRSL